MRKKTAVICALLMMFSVIPVFALNQTNNTTGQSVQDQANCTAQEHEYQHANKNDKSNCNCDLQKKNQYGQKKTDKNGTDKQKKYQYGLKNGNKDVNCQNYQNCPNK